VEPVNDRLFEVTDKDHDRGVEVNGFSFRVTCAPTSGHGDYHEVLEFELPIDAQLAGDLRELIIETTLAHLHRRFGFPRCDVRELISIAKVEQRFSGCWRELRWPVEPELTKIEELAFSASTGELLTNPLKTWPR
jgi:hypothetical protein